MAEREGTIRFSYELRAPTPSDLIPSPLRQALESWRHVFEELALIGRERERYDGFAFGNLSVRDPASCDRFFITASQTSDSPIEDADALPRIDACDLNAFHVVTTGTRAPSSESVTHAMVYRADHRIDWLFHVHSPDIWRRASALRLATTGTDVPYGSPMLAQAVSTLLREHPERPLVFATLGHEDGVFACGSDADSVGAAIVIALAHAHALVQKEDPS